MKAMVIVGIIILMIVVAGLVIAYQRFKCTPKTWRYLDDSLKVLTDYKTVKRLERHFPETWHFVAPRIAIATCWCSSLPGQMLRDLPLMRDLLEHIIRNGLPDKISFGPLSYLNDKQDSKESTILYGHSIVVRLLECDGNWVLIPMGQIPQKNA